MQVSCRNTRLHQCNICNADLYFSSLLPAFVPYLLILSSGFSTGMATIELLILLSFFIGVSVGWQLKKLLCPAPSLVKISKILEKSEKTTKSDADVKMVEEIYICRTGHKFHLKRDCVKHANPVMVYSLCLRCKKKQAWKPTLFTWWSWWVWRLTPLENARAPSKMEPSPTQSGCRKMWDLGLRVWEKDQVSVAKIAETLHYFCCFFHAVSILDLLKHWLMPRIQECFTRHHMTLLPDLSAVWFLVLVQCWVLLGDKPGMVLS